MQRQASLHILTQSTLSVLFSKAKVAFLARSIGVLLAVGLGAAASAARSHISSGGAAAAHAQIDQPGEDGKGRGYPHKDEHLGSKRSWKEKKSQYMHEMQSGEITAMALTSNVEILLGSNDFLEDNEHGRGDDGSGGREERSQECPETHKERPPSAVDGDPDQEHADKAHAYACQEEAEHQVRHDPDEFEDRVDISGQRDGGPREQLVE